LAETTGQRDFAVGVPVAQRYGPGLEHAIGCYINTLCVRLRGEALGTGMVAVEETGRVVGRAFAAQDVPFVDVLRLADRPRTVRPPLFQTMFALQDNAVAHLGLRGLRTTFIRQPYLEIPLELHAELWPEDDGGLRLTIYFRTDVVPESIAVLLAKRLTDRVRSIRSGDLS
jgi:non-ribosomal peptide synthetase component F